MDYKKIEVDFLLNKITSKDKLFSGDYTIDPYQNCEFGCLYCDSSFFKTIKIKTNSTEVLDIELATTKKGVIIVGSVHDAYQKAEKKYQITRSLLEIIKKHGFSCNILTKSNLVLRDIDILKKIDYCKVTISLISLKNEISNLYEKNVPSPKIRLETVKTLNENGIKAGLAIMPVLPFIVENEVESIIKSSKEHNAQYLLNKHLELKGDQKKYYINILRKNFLDLVEQYEETYKDNYMPNNDYIVKINNEISKLCKLYHLKNKI
jgi:DNA repair photolyase